MLLSVLRGRDCRGRPRGTTPISRRVALGPRLGSRPERNRGARIPIPGALAYRTQRERSCSIFRAAPGRWLTFAQYRARPRWDFDLCLEMLVEAQKKPALTGRLAQADTRCGFRCRTAAPTLCCAPWPWDTCRLWNRPSRNWRDWSGRAASCSLSDFHPDAIERGWKRTFRNGGQSYEIETARHTTNAVCWMRGRRRPASRRDGRARIRRARACDL